MNVLDKTDKKITDPYPQEGDHNMDPNECLVALRDLAQDLINGNDEYDAADTARSLAEHVEAMDEWLTRGGFAPDDWRTEGDKG